MAIEQPAHVPSNEVIAKSESLDKVIAELQEQIGVQLDERFRLLRRLSGLKRKIVVFGDWNEPGSV